ncbi:hypothetical protein LguiB_015364 [Lonicera macranthoides]
MVMISRYVKPLVFPARGCLPCVAAGSHQPTTTATTTVLATVVPGLYHILSYPTTQSGDVESAGPTIIVRRSSNNNNTNQVLVESTARNRQQQSNNSAGRDQQHVRQSDNSAACPPQVRTKDEDWDNKKSDFTFNYKKECPICLDEFKDGERCRILSCKHAFHISCVDVWLAENHTCPICRMEEHV